MSEITQTHLEKPVDKTELTPTAEQQAVIDNGQAGNSFVVDACAGSGKTWVLNQASRAMSDRSILYLVYNTAASKDAKKVFPGNAEVRTTSSLAYQAYKRDYGHRLIGGPRVTSLDTARILKINQPLDLGPSVFSDESVLLRPTTLASMALETVQRFCYSADPVVKQKHIPAMPLGLDLAQEEKLRREVTVWARKLWESATQVTSNLAFSFDHAFKMYAASSPDLHYDTIMLDEAQDSNPIVEHFIKAQSNTQLIVVGDPAQQLYGWRNATDIMGNFEGPRLSLSRSWRFGEDIAEEANKWLAHTDTGVHVHGNPSLASTVSNNTLNGPGGRPQAVLCPTNSSAVVQAITFLERGLRVAMTGGTQVLVNLAYAANDLRKNKPTTHRELAAFRNWAELVAYTEEPGGGDLKAFVGIINIHGTPAIIDACKKMVDEHTGNPDVTVSTAHKSKGREWGTVLVSDDFREPKRVKDPITQIDGPGPILKTEAMLNYVTVTRARRHLDRGGLAWIDDYLLTDKI